MPSWFCQFLCDRVLLTSFPHKLFALKIITAYCTLQYVFNLYVLFNLMYKTFFFVQNM